MVGNRGAETPTRRALSLQEHHWGSLAFSFVLQEIGPNTPRHSVSPLARALTRASLATVNTRTCIRQAASDPAIYRALSRTMTVTRPLVVDANGGSRCRVQPNTQMVLHILRGASRIQGPVDELNANIPATSLKKRDRLFKISAMSSTSCSRRRHVLCGCAFGAALRRLQRGIDLRCLTRCCTGA